MTNTVSLKQLRPNLREVIGRIDGKLDRYIVTSRGKPVAVMMSVTDYESLIETLDILADRKAMAGLRRGEKDIQEGRVRPWANIKKALARL